MLCLRGFELYPRWVSLNSNSKPSDIVFSYFYLSPQETTTKVTALYSQRKEKITSSNDNL